MFDIIGLNEEISGGITFELYAKINTFIIYL